MKLAACLAIASLCLLVPARAASVDVSDTNPALPGLAQEVTGLLADNGLPFKSIGGGKFTLTAKGFHCDQRSNGPLDAADKHGGLPTLACRIGAKNLQNTHTGKHFGDGYALSDLLTKVSMASPAVQFSDCALGGYCGTFVKSITCTIDTHIDNFNNGGRWSCAFVDGQ